MSYSHVTTRTLKQLGGSLAVILPKRLTDRLTMFKGDYVTIKILPNETGLAIVNPTLTDKLRVGSITSKPHSTRRRTRKTKKGR